MPPGSRASGGSARGTRGGRGGRGRGASSQSNDSPLQSNTSTSNGAQDDSGVGASTSGTLAKVAIEISSGRSTPTGSRTPLNSDTKSRGPSRFRPKNVRRDEAERKRLEDDRNRDLASKIKAEERELRAEERRARRGRGRGAASRGLVRRTVTANGPFSAISSENVKNNSDRGGWASGLGFGGGSTRNAFRQDPENRIRYHPRREHEARVNIDLLNGLTDGHAPDGSPLYQPSRYTQSSVGNLPIGMHRTLHQDPEIKVKTQAELEAEDRQSSDDEGNLFVDAPATDSHDIGMDDDNEIWHAAPKTQVKVKAEPGTEEETEGVDMADIPEAPKAPSSPEMRKKPTVDEHGLATDTDEAATAEKLKRKKKIAEDPEFMHSVMDMEALLRILSFKTPTESAEGEDAKEDEDPGKDDQLFLFQFPPILPPLVNPSKGLEEQPEAIGLASSDNEPRVKLEGGVEASRSANTTMGLPSEGGYIGRLNVRKSGKVELDWGGITLSVGMGIETDFLTTAMIIEQKENVESAEESAGSAYGMGQIFGQFAVGIPCEDEEEWIPDIEDIMAVARGENPP
ncbi:RNA polymerase III RPC4-domain-containing protein [Astrocystis sublimbata]|nr:RNA polymerase III RPC4-domain-containing protein [Astrocystis sublimbata]